MNRESLHISAVIMAKNETKRLRVTLESIKSTVKSILFYDTGSTDDTIEIVTNFCKENDIDLRLIRGEFVDFSTSRNIILDHADNYSDIHFLLLLDVNDELKNSEALINFSLEEMKEENDKYSGYLVCQEWWSGQYDKYYNIRYVKANNGWRYRGVVHEWIKNTNIKDDNDETHIKRVPDVVLYQDRTQDDDKSQKRFQRDKELLLEEYNKDPDDPRTSFYLAQTFSCLEEFADAFYYYKIRAEQIGFWEERFHAYYRCGEIAEKLGHPWSDVMSWYIKAIEQTQRAEPLFKIADHYNNEKNWFLAFHFINMACDLPYPDYCNLFVDKYVYDYKRWHLMGIVAYYAGKYDKGYLGCKMAISAGLNKTLDESNLKYYEDKIKELQEKNNTNSNSNSSVSPAVNEEVNIDSMNKNQFIDFMSKKLLKENPNLSRKHIANKLKQQWKDRNSNKCS